MYIYIFLNYKELDNVSDQISIPMLYYLRHSIELLLKAFLIKQLGIDDALKIMTAEKHCLGKLIKHLRGHKLKSYNKIKKILYEADVFDSESDLFRYPFKEAFLSKYRNKFLNTEKMSCILIYCYNLIHKCITASEITDDKKELEIFKNHFENTNSYIIEANHGYGNCFLWQAKEIDPFIQVEGFSDAIRILWYYKSKRQEEDIELPLMYSLRHANELACKSLVQVVCSAYRSNINSTSSIQLKDGFIPGHDFKRILKKTNVVINDLVNKANSIGILNDIFQANINMLRKLDKDGDYFRYPISKGGTPYEYDIDIKKFTKKFYSTFDFLHDCYCYVEDINDNYLLNHLKKHL